jgi:hypothetical protein
MQGVKYILSCPFRRGKKSRPAGQASAAKADVAAFRGYLEDLQAAVSAAIRASKSVDQLKEEIKLEKYAAWGQYKDFLPLNVQGMYGYLSRR